MGLLAYTFDIGSVRFWVQDVNRMPYRKWEKVEQQYNKPMKQVLIDLYAELGSHSAVAQRLNVSLKGLGQWRKQSGCEAKLRIECQR